MDIKELKQKLKSTELHPIHVEGSPLDRDMKGNDFIGSLDEYFEAVHALGIKAVFIYTETLDDERFEYMLDNEDEEVIDLAKFSPPLKSYKKHIGHVGMFKLSTPATEFKINFYISEDWWLEFINLWTEVTDRLEDDQEAAHEQLREEQKEKEKQLLKKLGNLIRDENFVRLPTQRAMLEYAKERIPELDTLNAITLKSEIQNLNAKIKAR